MFDSVKMSLESSIKAKQIVQHDKTIAIIMGDRPDFDQAAAEKLALFLENEGYYVHYMSVDEFCRKNLATIGFLTIIPHAESLPAICSAPIEKYWKQGGQILVMGGPLFGKLVEEIDGKYQFVDLDPCTFDATFSGKMDKLVIEGLVPTYKLYLCKAIDRFTTENDQVFTKSELKPENPVNVLCPVARPHGLGIHKDYRNRYIPLISAMNDGERANGRGGAAAYFMLSNTRGHLPTTNGSRPGTVSATTCGSVIAGIGIQNQDILTIPGAKDLVLSMVDAMHKGIFLFEGGSDRFTYHCGDTAKLGAKILNISQDYLGVTLMITVSQNGHDVYEHEDQVLLTPRNFTEVCTDWCIPFTGEYDISVCIFHDYKIIDKIDHQAFVSMKMTHSDDEFIKVVGSDFFLGDKPWYAFGINYWPHYYPGFEREDYWMGWLDKSNYDPLEIERDLTVMGRMGINCLFTRLDGDIFGRSIDQLRDFIYRCEKHQMKISLSYPNVTCPLFYQPEAFREFMIQAELYNNPVIFCHDIAWEIGTQFFAENYLPQWFSKWKLWLVERYGSISNAENDFGMAVDRADDGSIVAPPVNQFNVDGKWRIKIAAFRRFIDDMVSRIWNDVVTDMRAVDHRHLIGYRMGPIPKTSSAITATNKHIDFSSPEGYCVTFDENGYYSSFCLTRILDLVTRGKPVIWSEYGPSLVGTSGNSPWSALKWDKNNLSPYDYMLDAQLDYNNQFFRMFQATGVSGSAPWWFSGGFRAVERSDCGFCSPNGVLRPVAIRYSEISSWFKQPRHRRKPDYAVTVDPDNNAGGWGSIFMGDGPMNRLSNDWAIAMGDDPFAQEIMPGIGLESCREADKNGKYIEFRTPGTGTTSVDTPLLAVGNMPCNGSNPPKYLNSEFNYVYLRFEDGQKIQIRQGQTIRVPANRPIYFDCSVGNLQEAEWIAPVNNETGSVFLVSAWDSQLAVQIPIPEKVPYLQDSIICNALLSQGITEMTKVVLYMEALNRVQFGEKLTFILEPSK